MRVEGPTLFACQGFRPGALDFGMFKRAADFSQVAGALCLGLHVRYKLHTSGILYQQIPSQDSSIQKYSQIQDSLFDSAFPQTALAL